MPSSKQGKKSQQPPSQQSQTERSTQGTSASTRPIQLPPEPPVQTLPTRKRAREPSPKQLVQEQENAKGKQVEQPVQVNTKGKQPEQPRPQQPVQADPKGKQPEQPRPQQPVQADPKGKQVEQPVQVNTKGKQPEQPRAQQPVQADPKGKQVEQPVQAKTKGKPTEQPRSQQPVQADPKGKQVEQPVQASFKSKQPQQASPEQSKHPSVKGKQPQKSSSEQQQQVTSAQQPRPRKAILANANPVYLGSPKVYIARIPWNRNAKRSTMHRVEVSLIPVSYFRHPQTLFFKNLPDVERYWGFLNDAATTAQRIVRLEKDGQPMPYFLLVCRGEYPKVTSPRNDNALFAAMHEPIFGDAFVFKLEDPEVDEDGYARYAHIEKDVGSIDWLPEAIKDAARKVEYAMSPTANPGFPDLANYADRETMMEDVQKMYRWIEAIRKANRKYESAMAVDAISGLPDLERMKDAIVKLTKKVDGWKRQSILPIDGVSEPSDFQTVEDFVHKKVPDAFKAFEDNATVINAARNVDGALSAQKIPGSSGLETSNAVKRVTDSFHATKKAYGELKAIASVNFARTVVNNEASRAHEIPAVIDLNVLGQMIDTFQMQVAIWEKDGAFSTDANSDLVDRKLIAEFLKKIQVADQAMKKSSDKPKIARAVIEVNDVFQVIRAKVEKLEAFTNVEVADTVDAARTSDANPEMPDLPGHPGTSRYRVERLD
ncbi:hypothetical protein HO133_010877 [Letharia lupina]|uniref:Uncharacterized protein n=1 Tax=Letharia lupina TaxID=560253 RepID=A0A8H6FDG3_9LECA|nr:uncharacterized protein HO133_010877 [Letharia lupina]KAF6224300.1 hypothetical protein HO133_010877 [Letharia lupina]